MIKNPMLIATKASFLLLLSLTMIACKVGTPKAKLQVKQTSTVFLSVSEAVEFLSDKDVDGYYDVLSLAHMSIQSKDPVSKPYEKAKQDYMDAMLKHPLNFQPEEKVALQMVIDSALQLIEALNTSLLPDSIYLIKVDEAHYGSDVFYTMGKAIIIPDNVFKQGELVDRLPVILHEIWHILSRYRENLREEAYALIGFYPHNKIVNLDPLLKRYQLINPDGVSTDYAIKLAHSERKDSTFALPLIRSVLPLYEEEKPNFFDYLLFDLYNLDIQGNTASITVNSDGSSQMDPGYFQNFFTQIGDNTQYIIHPDEIMADNFKLAVMYNGKDMENTFSSEGRELLKAFTDLLAKERQ